MVKAVQNGKAVVVSPDHAYEIRNAPFDKASLQKVLAPTGHEGPIGPAKEKRVNDLFDKGQVEMPIILKTSQGLWLIGGKTRLGTANYVKGLPAKVWLIGGKQGMNEATGDERFDNIMSRIRQEPTIPMYQSIKDEITEAFDYPYKLKWEKSSYGDIDASATLDDGNYLNISFNQEENQDGKLVWNVEFDRNYSQAVTGEGDAQRVFATVLSAIQIFIKKYKPLKLAFGASKEVDQGQNSQSRARLYDSLVQRYARAWGYRVFRADTGNLVIYEFSRIQKPKAVGEDYNNRFAKQGVAEATGDERFDTMMGQIQREPTIPDPQMPPTDVKDLYQWAVKNNKPYHKIFAEWAMREGYKSVAPALMKAGNLDTDALDYWTPEIWKTYWGEVHGIDSEMPKHWSKERVPDELRDYLETVFDAYDNIWQDWPTEYRQIGQQGVAEGSLNEFAQGSGGGESGRWYTDDEMTDIVGDGWWQDMDVSGANIGVIDSEVPKEYMIQQAQAWLDDQGYSVQVLNCKVNDDDMEWYIEGSFQNSGFAKKGVAEDQLDELSKDTIRNYVRAQPARIKGPAGLATTDNRKAARIVDPVKGDIRRAMDKYKDPEYGQQRPRLPEDSLAAMRRLAGVTTPAAVPSGARQYRHMPTAVQPR